MYNSRFLSILVHHQSYYSQNAIIQNCCVEQLTIMLTKKLTSHRVSLFENNWKEPRFCYEKEDRSGPMVVMFNVENEFGKTTAPNLLAKLQQRGDMNVSLIKVAEYGSCFFLALIGSITALRFTTDYLVSNPTISVIDHEHLRQIFVDFLVADYNLVLYNGQTILEMFAHNNPDKVCAELVGNVTFPVVNPAVSAEEILLVELFTNHCEELRLLTTYADELCVAIAPSVLNVNLTIGGNDGTTWFDLPHTHDPAKHTVTLMHEFDEREHYHGTVPTLEFVNDSDWCPSMVDNGAAINKIKNFFLVSPFLATTTRKYSINF